MGRDWILIRVVQKDPDTQILIQRSSTSGTTGSKYKWSKKVVLQHPEEDPGSRYNWSKKGPDTSRFLIQRSCTSGRSYRILVQVVQKDPNTEILHRWSYPIQGSWYRDPETEVLHKWSYKILIKVVEEDPHTEILGQRSCTSGPTGSWYSGPKGSWYSGPERSWYGGFAQVVLQDPETSVPKGSSYRDLATEICTSAILQDPNGSWYRDLAQVVLQDPDKWSKRILI